MIQFDHVTFQYESASVPALDDENRLYNENGTIFEQDGKPLHFSRSTWTKRCLAGRRGAGSKSA